MSSSDLQRIPSSQRRNLPNCPAKCKLSYPFINYFNSFFRYILISKHYTITCCTFRFFYTYLQNKRMRRCGVAPPPITFERLKLPQQIIYRRKENLSESPNHQKYWENILVSRFYEQFSRNRRNLGHFRKFEKISNS